MARSQPVRVQAPVTEEPALHATARIVVNGFTLTDAGGRMFFVGWAEPEGVAVRMEASWGGLPSVGVGCVRAVREGINISAGCSTLHHLVDSLHQQCLGDEVCLLHREARERGCNERT